MSEIVTYHYARKQLDEAIYELRKTIEKATVEMQAAAWPKVDGTYFTNDGIRGMAYAYQECAHRQALLAWLTGRAALVGLIRPHGTGPRKAKAVSTRNRYTKGKKANKPFPSDSTTRTEIVRAKGTRARYSARFTNTYAKEGGTPDGLPKLAILENRVVGRPKVSPEHRLYMRKLARGKQLKEQRANTGCERFAKGWRAYPENRKGTLKGWSNFAQNAGGGAPIVDDRRKAKAANVDFIKREGARKKSNWKARH